MIHIIIPVHNRIEFTVKCLDSLRSQTYKNFKIIVVDDGSTDQTKEVLTNNYSEVHIIEGNGNLFWTAAINIGIREALSQGASAILTLNNDTLASPAYMEKMVFWHKKQPSALLGSLPVDRISMKPIIDNTTIGETPREYFTGKGIRELSGLHELELYSGRGLLIPKLVFDRIGLFNQKLFPHYMADYDFTHQAFLDGFKIFCNHDAVLYIYPLESGDRNNRKRKTLGNFYNHLFGLKGGGNLIFYTRYFFRNSKNPYNFFRLLMGYARRIIGYFLK